MLTDRWNDRGSAMFESCCSTAEQLPATRYKKKKNLYMHLFIVYFGKLMKPLSPSRRKNFFFRPPLKKLTCWVSTSLTPLISIPIS
ncbi:hypothetical protein BpHYR1_032994 [Brachionus plicatilis]|uniref:Uncharacterized protein n=1 Tax=Brachionus plicatilis TaxID=10195 RepID=A0A3M7RF53_BRAPC|nr:hypothetical protein BpHYR1_032994 [Brachionus plicatilis]